MKSYWKNAHQYYSTKDWVNQTTIFAKFAGKYFPKRGRLLDLGAGQGQDSRYFARLGYRVISTDITKYALERSQAKAEQEKLEMTFMKLDILDKMPFEDNSVDIVYSHLALHYFSDKETKNIFQEIYRVLKPQGIIASLFNTVEDPETADTNYIKVEKDYYKSPEGILKRYFSVEYLEKITKGLFIPIVLDNKGETYKDDIKTLIRFIGKANK